MVVVVGELWATAAPTKPAEGQPWAAPHLTTQMLQTKPSINSSSLAATTASSLRSRSPSFFYFLLYYLLSFSLLFFFPDSFPLYLYSISLLGFILNLILHCFLATYFNFYYIYCSFLFSFTKIQLPA